MAEPRDDMISKIIASEIDGRQPSFEELMSIGFLMFLAGLDTVTNAMSFGMRHLAHDDGLRQRAIDDPAVIPSMVEELLRRYAFVATTRYIVEDTELEGVRLFAGGAILAPLPLVGWDEDPAEDPKTVSVERPFYRHAAFGSGIHPCPCLHPRGLKLIVFFPAWFGRLRHFRPIEKGDESCRGGC